MSAALALLAATASVGPAAAEQVLVDVVPGNGEFLQSTPAEVRLTFAEPLDDATVTVTVHSPSGVQDARPQVGGRDVTVAVRDDGPGQYRVEYAVSPGEARGETAFQVLAAGEQPPEQPAGSPWWWVAGVVMLGGLAIAIGWTVRQWRSR